MLDITYAYNCNRITCEMITDAFQIVVSVVQRRKQLFPLHSVSGRWHQRQSVAFDLHAFLRVASGRSD